ncbi:signal peptidase II [Paenibacillus sp. Leaf72]|uniref:signal peptidase II n=1 Tax=Paenibacillus sp. Leaf72 TaxID=1736234 RepID=UPI0006F8B4E9|nr:signal peptidase II [Paenibacillus sp. Leaf72]KQN97621.1 signal peptidase II [Paenibacillus sp. Leaf72]
MRYYYYWIALFVFVVDFITKKIIATQLNLGDLISVIGNFFYITSHRNKGAAFGILQEQRLFFIVITIVILAAIIWYIQTTRKLGKVWLLTGLGLVLGGAFGNFLDRAMYGEVVDFLLFNFGSYSFPIFNVADSAICVGVALILIDALLTSKQEKQDQMRSEEDKESNPNEQQTV